MPRFVTRNAFDAPKVLAAGATEYSRWYEASDVGFTGFLSYEHDITGSVDVTVQRSILGDSATPVDMVTTTHTGKGIKDVDLPLAKFIRFKFTSAAGATITSFRAMFG